MTRRDLRTYSWRQRRQTILDRDGHECQIRGPRCQGTATEVDHIVPKQYGGGEDMGNLRAACKRCNSAAGARQRRGAGFSDPASTPAPPIAISLAGTRGAPMTTRVHRDVPR